MRLALTRLALTSEVFRTLECFFVVLRGGFGDVGSRVGCKTGGGVEVERASVK